MQQAQPIPTPMAWACGGDRKLITGRWITCWRCTQRTSALITIRVRMRPTGKRRPGTAGFRKRVCRGLQDFESAGACELMSSFRRKPNGGIESKDAPPVAAMPQGTAAQLPPVSEAPKQPVEIEAEPTPVEKAAASALRDRIAEMDRAEALVQQSSAPQPS